MGRMGNESFLGKWNDFEVEAFEIGADSEWDILEVLVARTCDGLLELNDKEVSNRFCKFLFVSNTACYRLIVFSV